MITYGVNRDEIMTFVEALLERTLADAYPEITADRIFWTDNAPENAVPPRPFISCHLPPQGPARGPGDRRKFPALEKWRVDVSSAAAGDYSVDVASAAYSVAWPGGTMADLVAALAAAVSASPDATVSAITATSFEVEGLELGARLFLDVAGEGLSRVRRRANWFERTFQIVEVALQVFCWGKLDLENPMPNQSGAAIASLVASAFNHPMLTSDMRRRGHVPARVTTIQDGTINENQQAQTMGGVVVALMTTALLDVQVSSTTEIRTRFEPPT